MGGGGGGGRKKERGLGVCTLTSSQKDLVEFYGGERERERGGEREREREKCLYSRMAVVLGER